MTADAQQQGTWYLRIVRGSMPGQSFAIDRSVVTVGRDSINGIAIDEPSVSRQHAQLAYQDGWFYVQDLGSANGIIVNGVRIDGPQRIAPGQEVVLSRDVAFVLEWVPGAQQTAAMEYASDAASPQDLYNTPTAQWQIPQQAPKAVQPQPKVMPQTAPRTAAAATGSGMTWLLGGCGVMLFLMAVVGIGGALMFTGVIPNPLAAPTNTPTYTPAAITPLPVIQTLTPTPTTTAQAAGQPTATPYPTYTSYPTYTPVPTQAATATGTPPPTPTSVPPTSTPMPTNTPVPTHTPTTPPPQPLSINHAVENVACISKSQYRINFGIYLEGGTGEYNVYRDIDEQKLYGPGTATSIPYELTWGASASAVGTFYVKSGGQRAESKFYVPNPDCTGF